MKKVKSVADLRKLSKAMGGDGPTPMGDTLKEPEIAKDDKKKYGKECPHCGKVMS